jgi:UDP:flavonoid glycosyltransferase YjiC (YdhE family)
MKLLIITSGRGMGHITRCLAIADEALRREASAQVIVATEEKWASLITRVNPQIVLIPQEDHIWSEWADIDLVRYLFKEELSLLERVQPDIVLHDNRPTVPMACELLGVPNALIAQRHHQPGGTVDDPFWTFPTYNQVLREHDIPPFEHDMRELYLRHLILIPSFPEFDPWLDQWMNDRVHYVGPLLAKEHDHVAHIEPIVNSGLPTLFVYGVLPSAQDFSRLVNAFRDEPFHLLAPGLTDVDFQDSEQSAFHHFSTPSYVPAPVILPHCAAAIMHGGHGMSMTLLMSGTPAIVLTNEIEYERWGNGKALEAMGVAKLLPEKVQWDTVLKEIKALLQDPSYHKNATKWKHYLQEWSGGPERAYTILKEYALTRVH